MTPNAWRSQNCFNTDSAMAPPICGSVPPPNSSINRSVWALAFFIMFFMLSKCEEYVLRSFSMFCSSPMSIMMFLKIPVVERSLMGMLTPHCNMYCNKPTVFMQTDLPPALGPDIIKMRWSLLRIMSSGTTFFPCFSNDCWSRGWMARIQSIWG